jgi:CHRD domain-containing protein
MLAAAVTLIVSLVFLGGALFGGAGAAEGGRTFRIALSGANEVSPPNPHGNDDRGSVVLTINPGERTVCWRFGALTLTAGEALPHMGHIHRGPAGVAGPVVLTLFGMPPNAPPTTTPTAPTSYPTGTVCVEKAPRSLLVEIFQNPRNFYVNLHNEQHPTGVVRGQLV